MSSTEWLNLFVFGTLLFWSVWGIFDKKALQSSSHTGVLLRLYVMALWEAPLVYIYTVLTQPGFHIASGVWLWTGFAAVTQLVSFLAYLIAMSITDASLVLGVTASYPLITQLLAVAFLKESFVPQRLVGALAIAAGVITIGGTDKGKHHEEPGKRTKLIFCLVFATLAWGIWGIFDKMAVAQGTTIEVWLAECVWELLIMVVVCAVLFNSGYRTEFKSKPAWFFAFLSALCLAAGRLTFLSALRMSSASYVLTITGCYPLLMYFFAVIWLREKFDRLRFAGILILVAGGIAVQLTQAI